MDTTKATSWPTAGQVMQTKILTVSESTSLSEVERLLAEYEISGAPVTNEAGHIVGVVSMRDLLERYAHDVDPSEREVHDFYEIGHSERERRGQTQVPEDSAETVRDIMTAQVHAVDVNAPLVAVAKRMLELRVHRILVQSEGRHVGLVSSFDVLGAVAAFE